MVIRDMLHPEHDPVRTDHFEEDRDDPGGGVLDGAPDRGRNESVADDAAGAEVAEPTVSA